MLKRALLLLLCFCSVTGCYHLGTHTVYNPAVAQPQGFSGGGQVRLGVGTMNFRGWNASGSVAPVNHLFAAFTLTDRPVTFDTADYTFRCRDVRIGWFSQSDKESENRQGVEVSVGGVFGSYTGTSHDTAVSGSYDQWYAQFFISLNDRTSISESLERTFSGAVGASANYETADVNLNGTRIGNSEELLWHSHLSARLGLRWKQSGTELALNAGLSNILLTTDYSAATFTLGVSAVFDLF